MKTIELARSVVEALEDKKGEDILLIDIKDIASFTDYFVVCTGSSGRMLDALAKSAQEAGRGKTSKKGRIEGNPQDGWVVVDFGDVMVHLFSPEQRGYYDLEELWHEGKTLLRLK